MLYRAVELPVDSATDIVNPKRSTSK